MIKVSFVLLAGLGIASLLRRQSAALRHWVLAATIACAAVTPALSAFVPEWQLPLPAFGLGRAAESITLLIPLHLAQPEAQGSAAPYATDSTADRLTPARLLGWTWIAGTMIGFGVLAIGLARLTWLARGARAIDDGQWRHLAGAVSRIYGLPRAAQLLETDHPTLLATWGVRRPKVILPRSARSWPADRVRIVLGHELAHVARRDWVVQMAGELLRCVYWFNPLAWIVCRRLRQESEQACDDAVLQLGVEGSEYAAHLLDVARAFAPHRTTIFPAPAMARPSSLERRVRAMLDTHLNRGPISVASGFAIAAGLVALTAMVAGIASAQSANASLSGLLEDAVGKILPDTTLVLSSTQTQQTFQATSDQTGHFSFASVPAGDYQLVADRPGFAKAQGRMTLAAGQRLNRDVVLQVGPLQETITIYGGPPSPAPAQHAMSATEPSQEFDPCSQSPVGGCITQPTKLRDQKPIYPATKNDAGVGGVVIVDARIGTDGLMKDFRLVSGDRELAAAAIEAFRGWRFSQTRLDGVPVEVDINVRTMFVAR